MEQEKTKLKLAFIAPTRWIKQYGGQGDFTLALAHLLDRANLNQYEKEIVELGLPILLDNSLFENGKPEGIDSVIAKARRIKAYAFFAPDYLFDANKTLSALDNTLYTLRQLKWDFDKIGVAAVVQANTEREYFELYDKLQEIPEVVLIGLSILTVPHCFGDKFDKRPITDSRIRLLSKLLKRNNNNKPCHMLGLGESIADLVFAKENCPFVVSNDSSCAFQNGLFNRLVDSVTGDVEGGKVKEKVDFELKKLPDSTNKIIQKNIDIIKLLCK